MPEFRPSKQRRQKSRSANQNNVSNTWQKLQPFESETHAHQNTIHAKTSESETRDINGNLHQDSLPVNNQETNIARNEVLCTESSQLQNEVDNVVSSMQSRQRKGSDCSMISIQSIPSAEIREVHDAIGNDESCPSNPCNESAKFDSYVASSKITVTNDPHHNNLASREPAVNYSHGRRPLTVPGTSRRWSGFRSSSCQRKPVNSNTIGNSMQSDFNKRLGDSVHMKNGANKKRHTPVNHPFPAAPYFNVPVNHLLYPNSLPYGSQMPLLNLTEHQRRLQIWNNVGCSQNGPFPVHQLAHERQFRDKNYGNAIKEKYSRKLNQNQPGKTNAFQNQFKSRKPSSKESIGINTLPCKDITNFAKDVQHLKPDNVTHSPELRSAETSGNQQNSDSTDTLLSESSKLVLASSQKTGNQIRYSQYTDIISQTGGNRVANPEHKFLNAHFDSNSDTRASKASQIVKRQIPTGVWASREYPIVRSNQIFQPYPSEVQGCTTACGVEKSYTGWPRTESFDAQTKHKSSCSFLDQTNAASHSLCTRDQTQCETVLPRNNITTMSNNYLDVQTMPPHFDPTVHPLQVFQNGQRREHNQRWLRQSTVKPLSECTSVPCFVPQNALVSDGRNNSDISNYAKEHQASINVTASTKPLKEYSRSSTSYTGNSSCMLSTDSNSTMNPSGDMIHISSTGNEAYSFHSGNHEFNLTINEEIEEEMKMAQRMSIPFKLNSERGTLLHSRLNPNANEFSPTLTDSSGNQFTMTEQKGVCYFKQDSANSVSHQEPNTSYEHEVAEVLVTTSDSIIRTYSIDSHFNPKEGRNFVPAHGQQTLDCYGSDYRLYNGYCTAPSDDFNAPDVYNTLPTNYVSELTPDSTLSANNQLHFAPSNNYFNKACTQFFNPVHSYMNVPREIASSEVQMHSQNPYTNPGYTLCSLVPMYVTQSPAATPMMPFSGTEYCLMQTPVAPGASFTVSAPGHMPSQTHPSLYSTPEQMTMTYSTQNYSFPTPVLNLQTYFEASRNNSSVDLNTPDLNKDLPNALITQNIASNENNCQTKMEESIHSGTTQNENIDNAVCAETCHVELNDSEPVRSNNHHANSKADSIGLALENRTEIISESDVYVAADCARDINTTTEFEECKSLLERLRNRGFTLEKFQNVFSEADPQRRCLEECLEVAFQIIKRSANKLTIDEMASIMLVLSDRKKI